jgi:hypothetical protein
MLIPPDGRLSTRCCRRTTSATGKSNQLPVLPRKYRFQGVHANARVGAGPRLSLAVPATIHMHAAGRQPQRRSYDEGECL